MKKYILLILVMFSFVGIKTSANEKYCLDEKHSDGSQICFETKEELEKELKRIEKFKEDVEREHRKDVRQIKEDTEEIRKTTDHLFYFVIVPFWLIILIMIGIFITAISD